MQVVDFPCLMQVCHQIAPRRGKSDLISLLHRGFKDFLVSSYANALDDKHFSSNAGDAIRGRETS